MEESILFVDGAREFYISKGKFEDWFKALAQWPARLYNHCIKWRYKNSLIPPFWWICSDSLPRKMKNENNLSWGPILKYVEKSGVLVNLDENNYTLTATQVDELYDSIIIYVRKNGLFCFSTKNPLEKWKTSTW